MVHVTNFRYAIFTLLIKSVNTFCSFRARLCRTSGPGQHMLGFYFNLMDRLSLQWRPSQGGWEPNCALCVFGGRSSQPPSLLRSPLATSVDNVCAMQRPLFPHDSSVFLFYLWVFAMLDYNYPWIFATLIHPIRRGRKGVVGSGLKSRVSRC